MKVNLKLLLFSVFIISVYSVAVFADAQNYKPTVRIRAAVIELASGDSLGAIVNRSSSDYTLPSSWNDRLLAFQSLNLSRNSIASTARADISFDFYNPLAIPDYATNSVTSFPGSGLINPNNSYNDPKNNPVYWLLASDMITERALAKYDVLLAPYPADGIFQLPSINGPLKDWIQKGGVLWYDAFGDIGNNSDYKLTMTPLAYLYLSAGSSGSVSTTNPILDYPFNVSRATLADLATASYNTGTSLGLERSDFYLTSSADKPSYGVMNVGMGKIIFTFGNKDDALSDLITTSSNDDYKRIAYNLFFYALGKGNSEKPTRLSQLLGDSITYAGAFSNSGKAIIDANRVIYTINNPGNYGVAIEGVNLTNGKAPDKSIPLSRPAVLGENNILVYNEDGKVYMYSGITYDTNGMDVNTGSWKEIYIPEDTDAPDDMTFANVEYAPVVNNNWVYYADNKGRLHSIYTGDLKNGVAQQFWVTKPIRSVDDTKLVSTPVIYSRTDVFGASVTEVAWLATNGASGAASVVICSVPVFVENEIPAYQPINGISGDEIRLNYMVYPQWSQYKANIYKKDSVGLLDLVCEYNKGTDYAPKLMPLAVLNDKDTTGDWDAKLYSEIKSDSGLYKTLKLNIETVTDSVSGNTTMCFSKDSKIVKNNSELKELPISNLKILATYVPEYEIAISSPISIKLSFIDNGILDYSSDGFVYAPEVIGDADGDPRFKYITKSFTRNANTSRQYMRDLQWSYYPHTGLKDVTTPAGKQKTYSHIEWGFPEGMDATNAAISYVSEPVAVGERVYFAATATLNKVNRTVIFCLESNPNTAIRIVDEDGDPVHLYTNKLVDGNWVTDKTLPVTLYQPDPANPNSSVSDIELNARDVSSRVTFSGGRLSIPDIAGLRKLKQDGEKNKFLPYGGFTTALPVYVAVDGQYLPVVLDNTSLVDSNYNTAVLSKYDNSITVWDEASSSNVTKKLYVDLSEWNQINWYSVLPGNTTPGSLPIVTGDRVMIFAETKDEGGVFVSNHAYTISPKANIAMGTRVLTEDISDSNLPDSIYLDTAGRAAVGSNLIAVPANISGTASIALFENNRTLITDSNKIMEIDGNGNATWRLINPEIWVNNSGTWGISTFPFNNPVKAKYLVDDNIKNKSTVVVADSGKGALMFFDKNGVVKSNRYNNTYYNWYFDEFADQYGLLSSGQPKTFSNISDFVVWTEVISDTQTRYHMTVADSGNKRIVDLTFMLTDGRLEDCYTDNNGHVIPYLNWVTYDTIQDKKFKYTSVDVSDIVYNPFTDSNIRVVVAGIANFNAAERNGLKKSRGGSVLLYSYVIDKADVNLDNIANQRFGKSIDGIGKYGDSIGIPTVLDDIVGESLNDMLITEIKGLKKASISGYGFNSSGSTDLSNMGIVICDDSGVIEYVVKRDSSNNPIKNANNTYVWVPRRYVPATLFGVERPESDKLIRGTFVSKSLDLTIPARFRPFSDAYYQRVGFGAGYSIGSNGEFKTNWMPIKAPVIPMDVKVLSNGNWLITNGYSGNLKYRYKNPYDGNVYTTEAKYNGDVLEVEFKDVNSGAPEWWCPRIIWSNNNFDSYTIDDYISGISSGSYNTDQAEAWNAIVENLDGFTYMDSTSTGSNNQPSALGKTIGGWKMKNTPLQAPKSADR